MQTEVYWDLEGRSKVYNAIAVSPLPHVRIACSKFDVSKICTLNFHFRIARLHAKYAPFKNFPQYSTVLYVRVQFPQVRQFSWVMKG